jgi:hypothetical protein
MKLLLTASLIANLVLVVTATMRRQARNFEEDLPRITAIPTIRQDQIPQSNGSGLKVRI